MSLRSPEHRAAFAAEHDDTSIELLFSGTTLDVGGVAQNIADQAKSRNPFVERVLNTGQLLLSYLRENAEAEFDQENEQHALDDATNILFDAIYTVRRILDPEKTMGDFPFESQQGDTLYLLETDDDVFSIEQYDVSGMNSELQRTIRVQEAYVGDPDASGLRSFMSVLANDEIEDIEAADVLRVASGLIEGLDS